MLMLRLFSLRCTDVLSFHYIYFGRCLYRTVSYWGQNSYGATHPDDPANWQQRLSFYCGDDSVIDAFPVAFLNVFFGTGGEPSINLANVRDNTFRYNWPQLISAKDLQSN